MWGERLLEINSRSFVSFPLRPIFTGIQMSRHQYVLQKPPYAPYVATKKTDCGCTWNMTTAVAKSAHCMYRNG